MSTTPIQKEKGIEETDLLTIRDHFLQSPIGTYVQKQIRSSFSRYWDTQIEGKNSIHDLPPILKKIQPLVEQSRKELDQLRETDGSPTQGQICDLAKRVLAKEQGYALISHLIADICAINAGTTSGDGEKKE